MAALTRVGERVDLISPEIYSLDRNQQDRLSIEDIIKIPDHEWQSGNKSSFGYPYNFWIYLPIYNELSLSHSLILADMWALTNSIQLFVIRDGRVQATFQAGDQWSAEKRPQEFRYPSFKIDLQPGLNQFYLHFDSNDIPGTRLTLSDEKSFAKYANEDSMMFGIVLGGLVIMAIYNLIIYFTIQSKDNLYYSLYVTFFIFFQLCWSGYAHAWFFDNSLVTDHGTITFAVITLMFIVKFTEHFLKISKEVPFVHKSGQVFLVYLMAVLLLQFINFKLAAFGVILANIYICIWILKAGIPLSLKGDIFARIYLIAWASFIVLDQFSIQFILGFLDYSLLTSWGLSVGALVEASLISFAMALKIYMLKKESMIMQSNEKRMQRDMQDAKTLQSSLITIDLPASVHHALTYLPASHTAGDWVCVEQHADGRYLFIAIADVTGHGLGSSLMTVSAIAVFKACIRRLKPGRKQSQSECLEQITFEVNDLVTNTAKGQFLMTASFFCVDLETGEASFSNAGHMASWWYKSQEKLIKTLFSRGSILGVSHKPKVRTICFQMRDRDRLFLATDGIIENVGREHPKPYSSKQLKLDFADDVSIDTIQKKIFDRFQFDTQVEDDMTLLILEFHKFEKKQSALGLKSLPEVS